MQGPGGWHGCGAHFSAFRLMWPGSCNATIEMLPGDTTTPVCSICQDTQQLSSQLATLAGPSLPVWGH